MKKLLTTVLAVLTCGSSYALPTGNPAEASLFKAGIFYGGGYCYDVCDLWWDPCFSWCDAFSFRTGFYGDFVFNRHMEVWRANSHRDIDDTEIFTNAEYLAVNFLNILDVFATVGATNINIWTNPVAFGLPGQTGAIEIETETDLSWSVGARLSYPVCGCFYLGLEGQYFHADPHIHHVRIPGVLVNYPPKHRNLEYREWQVGAGAAYRVQLPSGIAAVPYAAFKWSRAQFIMDQNQFGDTPGPQVTLYNLRTKKDWGYSVGLTLSFCDALAVTAEGRWGDEKAFYINGQFRF